MLRLQSLARVGTTGLRRFSTIPVNQVASVLKMNIGRPTPIPPAAATATAFVDPQTFVITTHHDNKPPPPQQTTKAQQATTAPTGNEANGVKMDTHMRDMIKVMSQAPGYVQCTRYVCKSEWAYELSFVFDSHDSFKAWGTSDLRPKVRPLSSASSSNHQLPRYLAAHFIHTYTHTRAHTRTYIHT